MLRRLSIAAALAVLVGVFAPVPVSAEVDHAYHWDHRTAAVGGNYRIVTGQFGGDLATDILFYGPGAASDSLWLGHGGARGTSSFTKVTMSVGGDYTPIAGDFGGDDYDDILFYGPGSATDSLWISIDTAARFDKSRKVSVGGAYQPKVLHDYRGLGAKDDILFLGPGAAKDYFWHFTDRRTGDYYGPGTYTSRELKVNGAYQLLVGDYSGDELDDVVLYQPGTAADYKWVSNAAGAFAQSNLYVNGTFQPTVVNGEDFESILWWGSGSAPEAYWTSNGSSFTSRGVPTVDVVGTPFPFSRNGAIVLAPSQSDGFFRAGPTEGSWFQLANAELHDQTTAKPLVGDFDDDGYADVLWYGAGSQTDELWYTEPSSSPGSSPAANAQPGAGRALETGPVAPR
ncbi:MAG: hypothetical protein JWM47_1702 [Acidimicrobiales bacterium]|nr:hypothetical protein [Acidimicrobiales bacterium]